MKLIIVLLLSLGTSSSVFCQTDELMMLFGIKSGPFSTADKRITDSGFDNRTKEIISDQTTFTYGKDNEDDVKSVLQIYLNVENDSIKSAIMLVHKRVAYVKFVDNLLNIYNFNLRNVIQNDDGNLIYYFNSPRFYPRMHFEIIHIFEKEEKCFDIFMIKSYMTNH